MAKANRVPKLREEKKAITIGTQQELNGLPHAEKLMAFAEGMTSNLANDVGEATQPQISKRFSAADAAREAGIQIEALVRMKLDSVSSVVRSENGWDVIVNVIELARIPHSTDVLASYHVNLDSQGDLLSYSRGNRYTRDQTGDVL